MTTFTPKIAAYCRHRAEGQPIGQAALLAGYKPSSAPVTASRLEPRADVQAEIKRLKAEIKAGRGHVGGDDLPDPMSASPYGGWELKKHYASSLELMQDVYNNPKAPTGIRIQAAKDALAYEHAKLTPLGKKAQKQADAEAAAGTPRKTSKFNTRTAPTGRVVPLRQTG
jgi:phage terminase small subunit